MDWPESIEELGFAIIPDVLAPLQIGSISEQLEHSSLRRTRAGVRHALRSSAVSSFAQTSELMKIARMALGAGAFPFRATLFEKSAVANWLVVWHQDTALPLRERREARGWGPWSLKEGTHYAHAPSSALSSVLALRIHLDDSTAENGPLRILPATHKRGVLTDDEVHQLALEVDPVDCLVSRGGVVAMRPLLVHSSSKSRSPSARRVLHIEYASHAIFDEGVELAIT